MTTATATKFTPEQQAWLDRAADNLDDLPTVQAWAPAMAVVGPDNEVVLARPWPSTLNIGEASLNLKSLSMWGVMHGDKLLPGTNLLTDEAVGGMALESEVFTDVGPEHHANLWRAQVLRSFVNTAEYEYYEFAGYRRMPAIVIIDDLMGPIRDAGDAFLRLMLQSARLVMNEETVSATPSELFGVIPKIAWNPVMPVPSGAREQVEAEYLELEGKELGVTHDGFTPHMHHWIVPDGVRIEGGDVRLGCWAGEGTVFMPTGYGNCNSVILGKKDKGCMVEGRLTGGARCGYDCEIGGGFSFLGGITGNSRPTRVGDRFVGGANGGTGVSFGDDVRILAGKYLMPRSRCVIRGTGEIVDAIHFQDKSGLTFVTNNNSGVDAEFEVLPTEGARRTDTSYLFEAA